MTSLRGTFLQYVPVLFLFSAGLSLFAEGLLWGFVPLLQPCNTTEKRWPI